MDTIHQQRLGVKKGTSNDFYDAENGIENHANDRYPGRRMLLGFEITLALLAGLIGLFHWLGSGGFRMKAV